MAKRFFYFRAKIRINFVLSTRFLLFPLQGGHSSAKNLGEIDKFA
jgi:hypothetical protein